MRLNIEVPQTQLMDSILCETERGPPVDEIRKRAKRLDVPIDVVVEPRSRELRRAEARIRVAKRRLAAARSVV